VNGHGRIDDDDVGKANESRDRRDVAHEIEIELGEKRDICSVRRRGQQQRVAVRRSIDDRLGGDVRPRAGAAFDDKLLTEPLR
jgi:hypothetical protein